MARTKSLSLDDLEIVKSPLRSENFICFDNDPVDPVFCCDNDSDITCDI